MLKIFRTLDFGIWVVEICLQFETVRKENIMTSSLSGEPYQVYSEVANTGKNLQGVFGEMNNQKGWKWFINFEIFIHLGSKKKIKWIFGYADSEGDEEVVLLHSLVSGKKVKFLQFQYLVFQCENLTWIFCKNIFIDNIREWIWNSYCIKHISSRL